MGKSFIDIFLSQHHIFLVISSYYFYEWLPIVKEFETPKEMFSERTTWVLALTGLFYLLGIFKRALEIYYIRKNQKQEEKNNALEAELERMKAENKAREIKYQEIKDNSSKSINL